MSTKIPFAVLVSALLILFRPIVCFAEINYVKVINDTKQQRLISIKGEKTTRTNQQISVDYKERRFDPDTYFEFYLEKKPTIASISIEVEKEKYQEFQITQGGEYLVSKLLHPFPEDEDWDYLSW